MNGRRNGFFPSSRCQCRCVRADAAEARPSRNRLNRGECVCAEATAPSSRPRADRLVWTGVPGTLTLKLSGAGVRLWETQYPAPGETPFLAAPGAAAEPVSATVERSGTPLDLYAEAFTNGAAALSFTFAGSGDAAGVQYEVKVEFLAGDSNIPADALQVGLWEAAFGENLGGVYFKHPDFINLDGRRFCVRVKDGSRKDDESVTVSLSTLAPEGGSHGQSARTVTPPRVSPGVFASTNLLLVSDVDDASLESPDVVPGISRRLFECELGGTVSAGYEDGAGTRR